MNHKKTKCIVFGTGQMASITHFYLTHDSPYEVEAFTCDREHIRETTFCERPVIAFEEVEKTYPPDYFGMILPLSYAQVNQLRAQKYTEAKEKGYRLINYISSKATVWPDLKVGENCLIFENNVIQPFVEIGNNVILWSGNHIGHHSKIMDHCYLASHVVVSGGVTIEPYCFLGVNATIRDNVRLKSGCVVGAGALILKNTPEKSVYAEKTTGVFPKTSDRLAGI